MPGKQIMEGFIYFMVCIDEAGLKAFSGRLFNVFNENELEFNGLRELLFKMDEAMDYYDMPQRFMEIRSMKKGSDGNYVRPRTRGGEIAQRKFSDEQWNSIRGRRATFEVILVSRQNASWQGYVMLPDVQEKFNFFSEIQLISILRNSLFQQFGDK